MAAGVEKPLVSESVVKTARAEANGKVILLGEHAVVYGVPSVAAGLGQAVEAQVRLTEGRGAGLLSVRDRAGTWKVGQDLLRAWEAMQRQVVATRRVHAEVRVSVPTRAGLGSSAAMGVALARGLLQVAGEEPTAERTTELAMAWERVFHGNPSGVDVAVAVVGGVVRFVKGQGVEKLRVPEGLLLCVGDTGERSSTKAMVEKVAKVLGPGALGAAELLREFEGVVERGAQALESGDWSGLGEAMNQNQRLLRLVGASSERAERLCTGALEHGALGAKVTGAGGGGCVVAVVDRNPQELLDAWKLIMDEWAETTAVAPPFLAEPR